MPRPTVVLLALLALLATFGFDDCEAPVQFVFIDGPETATFTEAQTVTITATAASQKGLTIREVRFYHNDNEDEVGNDTTAPYTYDWPITHEHKGTHRFHAKADYTWHGGSETLQSEEVTYEVDIAPPTTTDRTPPSVPSNIRATAIDCHTIEVSWNAATDTGGSGLTGYDVYRNGSFVKQVLAPAHSFTDAGLTESMAHSYQVAAFDGQANRSSRTSAKSATTPACGGPTPGTGIVGSLPGFGFPLELVFDAASGIAIGRGHSGRLTIADVSDPTRPRLASEVDLEHTETAVAIRGDLAYVVERATGATYLAVLDLSNIGRPTVASRTALPGNGGGGVALAGLLAYVGNSVGLHVVDIANSRAPRVIRTVPTDSPLGGQVGVGQGFIVSGMGGGIAWFDARDQLNPVLMGSVDALRGSFVIGGGRTVYLARGYDLFVLDLSDLREISLIKKFAVSSVSIGLVGTRVYLPSLDGVDVFDLSVPTRLNLVEQIPLPGVGSVLGSDANMVLATDRTGTLSVIVGGP